NRWWGRSETQPPLPLANLETQVSGISLTALVALGEDGRFEALFEVVLPPARRGWRLARNRLTVGEMTAEGCGIVLTPPATATRAVVAVLPLAYSFAKNGPQELARSDLGARMAPALKQAQREGRGAPVYYVAGVPGPETTPEAELALAMTAL